MFPLASYTKAQVRELARKFGLAVAQKPGSQEICFLPEVDYRGFLKDNYKNALNPGNIIDSKGNILGRHKGIAFYTIGQREGLGLAMGYPVYVTKIDAKSNTLAVGPREEALKKEFLVREPHFILRPPKKKVALRAKIRYNHKESAAEILPLNNKIKVTFRKPEFAVTPGQSAVFYDGDTVIGGGIIE